MAILFCDICNKSIPPDEIRFAEKRNDLIYCRECREAIAPDKADGSENALKWGRWVVFMAINLGWLLAIVAITEVCGNTADVLMLSAVALLAYGVTLVWVHKTLSPR